MGIDGAEIKKLRIQREQAELARKQQENPPSLPDVKIPLPLERESDTTETNTAKKQNIITRLFTSVARLAGGTLALIVVFGIIGNFLADDVPPKVPKQKSSTSYSPPTEQYNQPPAQTSYSSGYADAVVTILNTSFGNVCHAEIAGFFSKTLKIDWTGNTNKLHAMKVFAEIGSVKEKLYEDGVRYFQFPNDTGTYNVIDWKSGEKESISDRAPYYFSD